MNFISMLVNIIIILLILFVNRYKRGSFVYFLPALMFVAFMCILMLEVNSSGDWNEKKHLQLVGELVCILIAFFFFIFLLSPTLNFTLYLYCPIYVVSHIAYMYTRYDMTNQYVLGLNMTIVITLAVTGFFLFYTLQMRELSRFF